MFSYFKLLVVCSTLLQISAQVFGQLSPEQALSSMQVVPGLQLQLFAHEPMFTNPTCIDVDERGRVWVCESVNYRWKLLKRKTPNRSEGDRIVILEDTNGDGQADKATTFYQAPDFLAPLGIAVAKNPVGPGYKVYVCHSPHLYVFEDKDGDGQADGPPEILLTGFGGFDHDHGIHGIHFGPEGKLYFSVGDQGVKHLFSANGKNKEPKPGEKIWNTNNTDCQAGTIWRCNTDGTELELLAHNFRNQYEPAVNSSGTMFTSDNDDDGNQQTRICHVMYGGNYGYWPRNRGDHHWHEDQPGIVHKTLRTGFGSPTGMCWYEGKLLFGAFSALLPAKSKPGVASPYEGFLLHTDAGPREVRLFGVRPQGAGYALDKVVLLTTDDNWFRPSDVCVAPDGSILVADWYDPGVGGHGMGDTSRGRIYRLTTKSPVVLGDSARRSEPLPSWIQRFTSPNLATRQMELQRGRESGRDVSAELKNLGSNRLLSLDQLKREFDAAHAREWLISYRSTEINLMIEPFWALAKHFDGQDRTYLSALNIALGSDPVRRAAILEDLEKHFQNWDDRTAWLVWELQPPKVVAKLGERLAREQMNVLQTELALGALAASSNNEGGESLLKLIRASDTDQNLRAVAVKTFLLHIHGKWKHLKGSDQVRETIESLQKVPELLPFALEMITSCDRKEFQEALEQLANGQNGVGLSLRYAAIDGLSKFRNDTSVDVLVKLLHPIESPEIRQRVISSLGLLATEKALGILKTVLLNANSADFERMQALQSLASSRAGTTWLLAAQDRNELPEDLLAETGRLLRSSPHQDLRNKAHLVFPVKAKMDIRKLPSSHELAKQIGSADRGKLLVMNHKDLACTKCHSVQGEGGRIGPDLSMIGIKGSKENLFDSILLPDKAIADQFIQYTLETRQGVVLTGLIVEETAEHIILRDANGKDTRIAQQDLAQRSKSSKSLMPDNLASFLTEDELIDVVSYLTTLKTPTLSIEYWRVLGPFSSNAPADVELKYKPGSDKLVDLHAKYTNKQGTLQWRTVPVNAQNQLDLLTLQGDSAAQGTTYLYAELEAGQTGSGKIQLATTEAIQVYWNGKQVLQQGLGPPTEGKFHSVPVEMPRGVNTLLIQVRSGTRPEPISCTILAPGQETLRLLR